jgi:hypothetical protein
MAFQFFKEIPKNMPVNPPEKIVLAIYEKIILRWELKLKNESGCWGVNRSRAALRDIDIDLVCVEMGEVETRSKVLLKNKKTNYIVFFSSSSQMKDLYRHLRNCAAHACISYHVSDDKESLIKISGKLWGKPDLAIKAQFASRYLERILAALVTTSSLRVKYKKEKK